MPFQKRTDYSSCVTPLPRLGIAQKKEMALLHAAQCGAQHQSWFAGDLENRDAAILVHAAGRLAAFTTITVIEAAWRGQGTCTLCTGDLVHDAHEETRKAIAVAWMRHAGSTRRRTQFNAYWLFATMQPDPSKSIGDLVKSFYVAGSEPESEPELFTAAFARESLRGEPLDPALRFAMTELAEDNLKPIARRAFSGTVDLHDLIAS
jgi:hypothetical protein